MVTIRNMTSNIVVKEVCNNQPIHIEMITNLQRKLKKMQRKYEEKLKSRAPRTYTIHRPCQKTHHTKKDES